MIIVYNKCKSFRFINYLIFFIVYLRNSPSLTAFSLKLSSYCASDLNSIIFSLSDFSYDDFITAYCRTVVIRLLIF